MSTIPEFAVYVTGADGSEAKVIGQGKALDSLERALAFMGARWNNSVETWDFGYYSETPKPDARPLYKVCGDIIREQHAKGRVPAKLVEELCRSILAADEQIKGYNEAEAT
jgi:hypothetical protein